MAVASTTSGKPNGPPKCRICGKLAQRGAALCPQCKAAVKRARQVPTVMSRFIPLAMSAPGSGGSSPGSGSVLPASVVPARPPAPKPAGWSVFAAVTAFGLAACVIGFFVALQGDDDDLGPTESTSAASAARHGATRSPRLVTMPAAETPASSEPADAGLPLAEAGPAPPSGSGKAPNRRSSAGTAAGAVRVPTTASGPVIETDAATPPVGAAEGGVPLPAAPPAAEPPVPDRWQAMSAAIASCGREDFFAGVFCEQRVRLRYCEGYWGDVPQCGRGFRFDGGSQR